MKNISYCPSCDEKGEKVMTDKLTDEMHLVYVCHNDDGCDVQQWTTKLRVYDKEVDVREQGVAN